MQEDQIEKYTLNALETVPLTSTRKFATCSRLFVYVHIWTGIKCYQ